MRKRAMPATRIHEGNYHGYIPIKDPLIKERQKNRQSIVKFVLLVVAANEIS